jgi:small GTP-binding protein
MYALQTGAANAGKSSLIERYGYQKFTGVRRATVGTDFIVKKLHIDDHTDITLQIWDTAGKNSIQERLASDLLLRLALIEPCDS